MNELLVEVKVLRTENEQLKLDVRELKVENINFMSKVDEMDISSQVRSMFYC